jgi:hypothetical protein
MTQMNSVQATSRPNHPETMVAPQHCLFTTATDSSPLFLSEVNPAKRKASSQQVFPVGNDEMELSNLVSQAVNAIAHKEYSTEDHLEKILQDSQEHWKVKLSESDAFNLFWDRVMYEVSRKLHYSTAQLSIYPLPETWSWNEVKVIQLGVVPSNR